MTRGYVSALPGDCPQCKAAPDRNGPLIPTGQVPGLDLDWTYAFAQFDPLQRLRFRCGQVDFEFHGALDRQGRFWTGYWPSVPAESRSRPLGFPMHLPMMLLPGRAYHLRSWITVGRSGRSCPTTASSVMARTKRNVRQACGST